MIGLTLISIFHVSARKRQSMENNGREEETRAEAHVPITLEDDGRGERPSLLLWYEKIAWFLWIISANSALLVTIEYWILIFTPPTSFLDISFHALNSVFTLTELIFGKIPVRILHWIYALMFAAIYAVFTIIYWAAGGENSNGDPFIYKILDYENGAPGSLTAMLLCSVFLATAFVQFILFGLYQLRVWLDKTRSISNSIIPT